MKKLLKYLITEIVPHPKEVFISEKEENSLIIFEVKLNPDDIKIVIGKEGRTIKSLRNLLRIKSPDLSKRIDIRITE